jgi:multisubunit Na+/H+ antiporter MnhB subunit
MSGNLAVVVDLLLAMLLLALAWAATTTRDMKRAVVLFIVFGLLLALVWARLKAPDLALAEAAIGAGIAGVLLLAALRREPPAETAASDPPRVAVWLLNVLTLVVAVALGWALLHILGGGEQARLGETVRARIGDSGVSNPVTAVLLNFRAYDTLLELAVILTAVLGILALGPAARGYRRSGPVLQLLTRWLVPLLILMSGYLLWVGAHAPGGAFQAGATLAAAAVLLHLAGHDRAGLPGATVMRGLLVAGVGVFVGVGLLVTAGGMAVLQYPPAWAGALILLIETAATLMIAGALALAYLGGRPADWEAGITPREEKD